MHVRTCMQMSKDHMELFAESPVLSRPGSRLGGSPMAQRHASAIIKLDLPFHLVRPDSSSASRAAGEAGLGGGWGAGWWRGGRAMGRRLVLGVGRGEGERGRGGGAGGHTGWPMWRH